MIVPGTYPMVFHVACNMRADDREEIYGLLPSDCPFTLANITMANSNVWIAGHERPIAVFGLNERRFQPTVWDAFAFATDEFPSVALEVTKFLKRIVRQELFTKYGANRVQAESHAGHERAHAWLKLLGARPEGVRRAFNKRGEDYITFAMTKADFEGRKPH